MPKPLVDILDEELDKLEPFYELSNYPEDWAENKASAKQAIIKAIKERVPEKRLYSADRKGYEKAIEDFGFQPTAEGAYRIGRAEALDQLNQNLWGKDD